jgi:hypothetical protein
MMVVCTNLSVRLEHAPVQVIGDLATILHFSHHVLECAPTDRAIVQMLLKEEDACSEVAIVVLVRDAPAKGAKLTTLLLSYSVMVQCSDGCIKYEHTSRMIAVLDVVTRLKLVKQYSKRVTTRAVSA